MFFLALWIASFFLNFFWESLHGLLFQDHPAMAAVRYVPMMLEMAVYDAFAVSGVYLLVSLLNRAPVWRPTLRNILLYEVLAVFTAAFTEHAAVRILHQWAYLPSMPLVFGLGITPLVQLALTGLVSILAAGRISFSSGGRSA